MFSIKSKIKENKKAFGFTNGFTSYGKNQRGLYRLEFNLNPIWGQTTLYIPIKLYQGKTKPKFRNLHLITLLSLPFALVFELVFTILFPVGIFLYIYFNGAFNFIKNSSDILNVQAFNWVNNILLICLLANLFIGRFFN